MPIFTVRADSGQYTEAFRRGGYAGIGWFDTPLADTSTREAIGAHYHDNFSGQSVSTAGQNVGQIYRFLNTIQPGDWLVTPYSNSEGALLVGQVQPGPAYFAPSGTDECPYCYRRPIRWENRLLYRRQFSESLRNTLGSTLTVFQVPQEQEFLAVVAGAPPIERPISSIAFGPEQAHEAVRQKLLELSAQEFEVLVSYVLRVLGFEGQVTRLSGDGGIDFEGELRVHGVAQIKLQVQVKRYTSTQINETELRNFRGAMKEGYQGCFITLSDFSRASRDSAANTQLRSVNLINGRQFVELFVQYYDLLLKLLAEEEADDLANKLRFRKALLPG
jgi:restriction system protein